MKDYKDLVKDMEDETLKIMYLGFISRLNKHFDSESVERLRLTLNEAHERGVSLKLSDDFKN